MGNSDNLFSGTEEYPPLRSQHFSDGGHHNAKGFNGLEILAQGGVESSQEPYGYEIGSNKYVLVTEVDVREDSFYVEVHEIVIGLTAKPSARIKNLRKRQLTRTVRATVAPIDDYNTIGDAVNAVAAKLRENYSARYAGTLEGPLEEALATTLKYLSVQPPGEA